MSEWSDAIRDHYYNLGEEQLPLIPMWNQDPGIDMDQDELFDAGSSKIQLMGILMLLPVIYYVFQAPNQLDGMMFFFLYFFGCLTIMIRLTGAQTYDIAGFGETKTLLQGRYIDKESREDILDAFANPWKDPIDSRGDPWCSANVDLNRRWIPNLPDDIRWKLRETIRNDKESNGIIVFDDHASLFTTYDNNANYIALFMFMLIPFLLYRLIGFSKIFWVFDGYAWLLSAVALEEILKGVGHWFIPTMKGEMYIKGIAIRAQFTKGMVAGAGWAFWEMYHTYAVLHKDPIQTFVIRIVPLIMHMIFSGIFFCGMVGFKDYRKLKDWEGVAAAIVVMLSAIFLHFSFNAILEAIA